jgi:pimeloyl-ACP methyl ester carboxylesterase
MAVPATLVLAALLTGVSAAGPDKVSKPASVRTVACDFGTADPGVTCGELEVWENRRKAAGRRIPIHFVLAKATMPSPAADPLVVLVGGPGQHASTGARRLLFELSTKRRHRDILILDQRGTGKSNPLDCFNSANRGPDAFAELFSGSFLDPDEFRSCKTELDGVADLTQYTTTEIANDLEELRVALGYEKLTLSGGSYGTRLALEFIRRYPASVRAAVLRGVVPSTDLIVETVAADFQETLEALIVACNEDAACSKHYPSFRADLMRVIDRVAEKPAELRMTNPATGKQETVRLHRDPLVTALRYVLYSSALSAQLPRQVQQALEGDYVPIAGILSNLTNIHDVLAEGMWASVKCTEEVAFVDPERGRKRSEGTLLGTLRLDAELALCEFWPKGKVPDDFHDLVVSDVPVLMIAGEHDPASPLRLARGAIKGFPNGKLLTVPDRSHWGLNGDRCIEKIVDRFLSEGSTKVLDTGCVEGYVRPPFVTSG